MLETVIKEEEKKSKRLGSVQPKLSLVWHIGLSGGAPDSVRCARLVSGEKVALGKRSAAYNYNSSDCQVHHKTEDKISLPRLSSMAPSCLGDIKGTPRRMEESSKHSLSILRLPHSASAHLIDCVSDLSSV